MSNGCTVLVQPTAEMTTLRWLLTEQDRYPSQRIWSRARYSLHLQPIPAGRRSSWGLSMEMGGTISHGAVVAREYGIPAAIGVAGATECITTGQQITVDGTAGTMRIEVAVP